MATITLSSDYGYVLLAASATMIVNTWHGSNTGKFRRRAKIAYPNCYATPEEAASSLDAYRFNCAQRAHAQMLENYPSVLAALFIGGIGAPKVAAAVGAAWAVNRVVYTLGYQSGKQGDDGKGRYKGIGHVVCQLVLYGMSFWTAYNVLKGGL
ncbi:MAG: hypothetical protein M1829_001570 [Trizodia sp. TS-e1964]|nr:MAG: hypothetical protein M1829_001570 [Trizodia sp. TS-e1964]